MSLVLAGGWEYVEEISGGKIFWSSGLVTAEGKGVTTLNTVNLALSKAMAEKAAIKNARNNLLNVLKYVRLDSANTVGTLMLQNDKYKEEIAALVQKAPPLDIKYRADSSVEVLVEVKLYGPLTDFYLQKVLAGPPRAMTKKEPSKVESKFIVSGLIIDARGVGAQPAFAPKILDETGKEIWGVSHMIKEVVSSQGTVVYVKNLAFAQTHPRAGEAPYTAKALRAFGPEKTDLVITSTDAQAIVRAAESQPFLAEGRIIILLDS